MVRKNKKGLFFMLFLLLITLILLGGIIIILKNKTDDFEKPIGAHQFEIINAHYTAEKARLYAEQSARFSADQALHATVEKGGVSKKECPEYLGLALWNFDYAECLPVHPEELFERIMKERMQEHLSQFYFSYLATNRKGKVHPVDIPSDLYAAFTTDGEFLRGYAKEDVQISLGNSEEKEKLTWPTNVKKIDRCFEKTTLPDGTYPTYDSRGLQIPLSPSGAPLYAVMDGTVSYSTTQHKEDYVAISSGTKPYTVRYYSDTPRIFIQGTEVKQGEVIGIHAGRNGKGLRIEIIQESRLVDPLPFFDEVVLSTVIASDDSQCDLAPYVPDDTHVHSKQYYALNPSFMVPFTFDIDTEYQKLRSQAIELRGHTKQCADKLTNATEKDNDECVAAASSQVNRDHAGTETFIGNWSTACEDDKEGLHYAFIENYMRCLDSEDSECTCSFENLDKKGFKGRKYRLTMQTFGSDTSLAFTEILGKDEPLGETFNYLIKDSTPRQAKLKFFASLRENKFDTFESLDKLELYFEYTEDGLDLVEMQSFGPDKNIWEEGRITFYKEDGSIGILEDGDYDTLKTNTKECQLRPKYEYRFCVDKPDQQFLVADGDGVRKERLRHHFAIDLRDMLFDLYEPSVVPTADGIQGDLEWPSSYFMVTSCMGTRNVKGGSKDHKGTDIRAHYGDPIYAIAAGQVSGVETLYNSIRIRSENGLEHRYLHNSKILVNIGDPVQRGQKIAEAGGKGPDGPKQYAAHLHLEIKKDGVLVDPFVNDNFFDPDELAEKGFQFKAGSNCKRDGRQEGLFYAAKDNQVPGQETVA